MQSEEAVLTEVTGRRVEFDYLRAFVIVLVLWHHAILAYTAFSTSILRIPSRPSAPSSTASVGSDSI